MKKKIFGGIAVLAIVTVAAWNMNFGSKMNGMPDVMLSNVEALAQESVTNYDCCNYCTKAYCGTFTPADGSGTIKVYYRN